LSAGPNEKSEKNANLNGRVEILKLAQVQDSRGNLTAIEQLVDVPFGIKRVYYLYDVPGGAERGGHAHKNLYQLLIAVSGSFDVHVFDGSETKTIHLNRAHVGLLIKPMVWREIDNFSGSSVCLVLASEVYDESDYFRDKLEFERAAHAKNSIP
jgi:dTDP-4-dehydrorhamnose 3,5-epimerase-like enzyme